MKSKKTNTVYVVKYYIHNSCENCMELCIEGIYRLEKDAKNKAKVIYKAFVNKYTLY